MGQDDRHDEGFVEALGEAQAIEARFRGLLDAAPDAMLLVNAQGRILLFNGEAERLLGYTRDELRGRPVELLVPERFRGIHPSHREHYKRDPRTRPMGANLDLFAVRKDGAEFRAEISLGPLQIAEGNFTSVSIRDVTERRRLETKFRALLEAAPDAIVIVDQRGTITIVNAQAERLFGYDRAELIGRSVEILVPPKHRDSHPRHREGYFAAPRPRAMGSGLELEAVRKDGTSFPVEISLSPLELEGGMLISSAIRDVTERKTTEDALKLSNKELESFGYSVAHDLRAPLRGMSGFAQILLENYGDKLDADGVDCLHEIRNNALRMSGLIDALLSLSSVVRSELRRERVDLGAIARAVGAQCAMAAPARTVELRVAGGLWTSADPRLVRTLLANLLENAWKFTAGITEACIEVGVIDHEGVPAFFVRDNGAGFDMTYAGRLFMPFQRLHAASEFAGTGIGLATAQRVVHRHGGRIWVESAPGAGATFYFTLPGGAR
jgi:PAS domain S-box-containing protein